MEFVEEWGRGLKPKDHPWLGGGGGVIVRLFSGTTQSGYTGMYAILVFGTNKPTAAFQIWNPSVGYRTHHHVGGKKYLELQH